MYNLTWLQVPKLYHLKEKYINIFGYVHIVFMYISIYTSVVLGYIGSYLDDHTTNKSIFMLFYDIFATFSWPSILWIWHIEQCFNWVYDTCLIFTWLYVIFGNTYLLYAIFGHKYMWLYDIFDWICSKIYIDPYLKTVLHLSDCRIHWPICTYNMTMIGLNWKKLILTHSKLYRGLKNKIPVS